jgi:hypothetical protein
VPWERRPESSRLLAELKRPDRGWSAVVVGEGTPLLVRQPVLVDRSQVRRVYAMIGYLGNVGAALKRGDPAELQRLYEGLRVEIIYHSDQKAAEAVIRLGRDSERVREGD